MFGCQSEDRFIFILMKAKHRIYIMLFKVVTSNDNLMPLFIFSHSFKLNTEVYIKCFKEIVLPWIERVAAGRPNLCNKILRHVTQAVFGSQKISATSSLTSSHHTLQIAIPLIIMCGRVWARNQQNQSKKEYRRKGFQEIPKSSGGRSWSQWRINLNKFNQVSQDIFV